MMRKHYLSLVDTHFSQSKNVHNDLVKNGHVRVFNTPDRLAEKHFQVEIMAEEPVAVTNTLASPLGPDRVGQVYFTVLQLKKIGWTKNNVFS